MSARCWPTDTGVRRRDLITWMRASRFHSGLTAQEIVDVSGIYDGHRRYDRCFDDLKALASKGWVTRVAGRPARWECWTVDRGAA